MSSSARPRANGIWMARDSGFHGRSYWLKMGATTVNATISEIRHTYNINTFEEMPGRSLELNDISVVKLSVDRQIAFEKFADCNPMGSFVLIDRQNFEMAEEVYRRETVRVMEGADRVVNRTAKGDSAARR